MKKKNKIYARIILCISLLGCNENTLKILNTKYEEAKMKFPSELITHFPSEIKTVKTSIYTRTYTQYENACFYLTQIIDSAVLYNLYNETKEKAIIKISASDTCQLVLNRFHTIEDFSKRLSISREDYKKIDLSCYDNKYPIPNFYDNEYSTDTTESRLTSDFEILVLESKSGKFWDDKYLYGGEYMPPKWQHGYSKGIAFSREKSVIIHWFIIW